MARLLHFFLCILIIHLIFALKCNVWNMGDTEFGSCTGDSCVSWIYSGSVRMMSCATNVMFSNRSGCYGDDESNFICSCHNARCNNYSTEDVYLAVKEQPRTSCFASSSSKCKGLSCSISSADDPFRNPEACVNASNTLKFIDLQANLILIDQTSRAQLINRYLNYYLVSDFNANCMDAKCVQRARQLRIDGFNRTRPQVECYSNSQDGTYSPSCKGDFCYHQNQTDAITRGCYTVDDSLAERRIAVGFYEYFAFNTYLCNTNFCNDDETSAKLNRSPGKERAYTIETTTKEANFINNTLLWIVVVSIMPKF